MATKLYRGYDFKKMEKRVLAIAHDYRHAQSRLTRSATPVTLGEFRLSEPEAGSEERTAQESIVHSVDNILRYLAPENRDLIHYDFLTLENPFWWISFYSRSTYYRIKKKAMAEFLSYLD